MWRGCGGERFQPAEFHFVMSLHHQSAIYMLPGAFPSGDTKAV